VTDGSVVLYESASRPIVIEGEYNFDEVPIEKLTASKNGQLSWAFTISKVKCEYFDSKDSLDQLFIEGEFECLEMPPICGENIERISIENIVDLFDIKFSCNMSYYLTHQEEIEKDLKRKIDLNSIIGNEIELKRLEQELFYNQMCELLGENEDANDCVQNNDKAFMGSEEMVYDKAYFLTDFRMLYKDGNNGFGTARRGNFYFLFYYVY